MVTQLFIAAGGKGRRLGAYTTNLPKSLVEVHGLPIIDHIIETAHEAEVDEVVVGVDDGKEVLIEHLSTHHDVRIEFGCTEPLTVPFLHSASNRKPDVILGVNGDTVYPAGALRDAIHALESDAEAGGILTLTSVVPPISCSDWTYWRHRITEGIVVAMDEVAGHLIRTEYVLSGYRLGALEALSEGFSRNFSNKEAPFKCYSYGWDYLMRYALWNGTRIIGSTTDMPVLNINHPSDIDMAPLFFTDPARFCEERMAYR